MGEEMVEALGEELFLSVANLDRSGIVSTFWWDGGERAMTWDDIRHLILYGEQAPWEGFCGPLGDRSDVDGVEFVWLSATVHFPIAVDVDPERANGTWSVGPADSASHPVRTVWHWVNPCQVFADGSDARDAYDAKMTARSHESYAEAVAEVDAFLARGNRNDEAGDVIAAIKVVGPIGDAPLFPQHAAAVVREQFPSGGGEV